MPNIVPVTDLKNYDSVLKDVAVGSPVFLTDNGRGRYAIADIGIPCATTIIFSIRRPAMSCISTEY